MIRYAHDRIEPEWPQQDAYSHHEEASGRIHTCALFVDFDNCFIHLTKQYSERIAHQFATDPERWSSWLLSGMPQGSDAAESPQRYRVLLRRVYLNPTCGGQFRNGFVRSGFEVIDTPSLTSRSKNAADIRMALDLMDELSATPRIDTFVLMSGDADFTPVLRRLRRRNRHSVVVSATNMLAKSYSSVADRVIMPIEFIKAGLGMDPTPIQTSQSAVNQGRPQNLLQRVADRLHVVASQNGGIPAHEIHQVLFKYFPEEFPDSDWFGFFSVKALAEHLVAKNENIRLVGRQPWRLIATQGKDNGNGHPVQNKQPTGIATESA